MTRPVAPIAIALLVALAAVVPAEGSFPGRNGLLAYTKTTRGGSEIHSVTVSGKQRRRLTAAGFADNPAWSPDGARIAFDRARTADGRRRLYVMRADGSREATVPTRGLWAANPAWSPDGRRLVFQGCPGSAPCGEGTHSIFTVRVNGGGLDKIAEGTDPVWSPNGRWIAYRGRIRDGECQTLVLIRPSGRRRHAIQPRRVDRNGVCSWGGEGADFSPDSRRLVYLGLKPTGNERIYDPTIYTVGVDGTSRRVVASRSLESFEFFVPPSAWSPDGDRLLWRDDSAVFTSGPKGGATRRVPGPPGIGYAWQPLPD